ncbi:MAG: MATE family efflux transporter, partial [Cetobacterium sp.]
HTVAGVGMGASIFMSQLWGKKDIKKIHEFLDISLIISVIVSALFCAAAVFFPENIIHIFLKDPVVTALGVSYLRIVSVSYLLSSITLAYSMALRSTAQTKVPMYASIIGIAFNGLLNYLFIFGKFGAPKMGVAGAALGTTISRTMELGFILFMIYKYDNIIATNFSSLKELSIQKFKAFFKIASPVIFNDIMWVLGISTYSIAYSKLGVNATATMQIAITVNNMFNIFGIGIGVASAIIIGNKIGEGKKQEAYDTSIKISQFGVMIGLVIAVLFYFLSPMFVGVFKISPETAKNVVTVLKTMAIFIPARFYAIIQVIGTLRGGGDVVYAIAVEMIGIWIVGIPLAFAAIHFIPGLSITHLYFVICLEEFIKCVLTYPRVTSYKWIKSLV